MYITERRQYLDWRQEDRRSDKKPIELRLFTRKNIKIIKFSKVYIIFFSNQEAWFL